MQTVKAILERVHAEPVPEKPPPKSGPNQVARGFLIDENELIAHLTGTTLSFDKSPFGAIIEAIERRAYMTRICFMCWGAGILDRYFERRIGKPWPYPKQRYVPGDWCPCCKGTGCSSKLITRDDEQSEFDAQPTAETQSVGPNTLDAKLVSSALILNRLSAMQVEARIDLARCYGPDGEACARNPARGRQWAIAPFTDAGAALLKSAKNLGSDLGKPLAALDHLAQEDALKPEMRVTQLLAAASKQAVRRMLDAELAWNAACLEMPNVARPR